MTELSALYMLKDLDADLVEESMELFETPVSVVASERKFKFTHFMNSGWGAAAVCVFVGLGVMAGILWMGRQANEPPYPPGNGSETISSETAATDPSIVETFPRTEAPTEPVTEGVLYEPITQDGFTFVSGGDGTCTVNAADHALKGIVTIPEISPFGDRVTCIAAYGFKDCTAITDMILPDSVTSIGTGAFRGCNGLLSIRMPKTLTSMGTAVFQQCTRLESIVMPSGLDILPRQTFETCTELKTVEFGEGLVKISDGAFNGCSRLNTLSIPGTLKSVGSSAFLNCCGLSRINFRGTREEWQAVEIHRIGNSQFAGTPVTFIE